MKRNGATPLVWPLAQHAGKARTRGRAPHFLRSHPARHSLASHPAAEPQSASPHIRQRRRSASPHIGRRSRNQRHRTRAAEPQSASPHIGRRRRSPASRRTSGAGAAVSVAAHRGGGAAVSLAAHGEAEPQSASPQSGNNSRLRFRARCFHCQSPAVTSAGSLCPNCPRQHAELPTMMRFVRNKVTRQR